MSWGMGDWNDWKLTTCIWYFKLPNPVECRIAKAGYCCCCCCCCGGDGCCCCCCCCCWLLCSRSGIFISTSYIFSCLVMSCDPPPECGEATPCSSLSPAPPPMDDASSEGGSSATGRDSSVSPNETTSSHARNGHLNHQHLNSLHPHPHHHFGLRDVPGAYGRVLTIEPGIDKSLQLRRVKKTPNNWATNT